MTEQEALELLAHFRVKIDEIDLRLVALLNERTRVVEKIGAVKEQSSLPVYEPRREDAVFQNVQDHNSGPLPNDSVRRIFERIIDEMRTIQKLRMKR
jgi:chorismate mutase-like protein